jgi:hypothetical protein
MSDGDDSGDGSGGWATWDEEHPSQYNNEGQGGGRIGATPQTGYNSGQQHTMDIAAQHGIQTQHLVTTTSYSGYSPPPAPTAPTPGVKQGTVPVKQSAKQQAAPKQKQGSTIPIVTSAAGFAALRSKIAPPVVTTNVGG